MCCVVVVVVAVAAVAVAVVVVVVVVVVRFHKVLHHSRACRLGSTRSRLKAFGVV